MSKVFEKLKLAPFEQDWGIINEDPKRLTEFINFYSNNVLNQQEQYNLMELIISSVNSFLLTNSKNSEEINIFIDFYKKYYSDVPVQYEYWQDLEDLNEFPIAKIIRANITS